MVTAKKAAATKVDAVKKAVSAKPKAAAQTPEVAKKTVAKKAVAVPTPAAVKEPAKTVAKAAAKAPAAKKATSAKAPAKNIVVSPEQRANYVQVAAFYIAERRGFAQGNPTDDWLAAEAEVDRLIASGQFAQ